MTTFSPASGGRSWFLVILIYTLGLPFGSHSASAQTEKASLLDPVLARHGGLARWREFGRVEYDLAWNFGGRKLADHQLFDLRSRRALVTAADGSYRLGFDGQEVWISPNAGALAGGKMPARFYVGTPFYFFGIPFVFADPGAKTEARGRQAFEGKDCDVTRVTFAAGTGDTPEDYYLLYSDAVTREARLVAYIVTYPAMRGGKSMEELEPHALVYDEWQEVGGGLRVLKGGRFFNWNAKEGKVEGEPLGTIGFSNVRFGAGAPEAGVFAKPAGAETAGDPQTK